MARIYFFLFVSAILLSSCASSKQTKWLGEHENLLSRAVSQNAKPEQKLDLLATSYTQAMHQTLNHLNPKKGVQFMKAYTEKNETSIGSILTDVAKWKSGMGTLETIAFGVTLVQKPYFRDLLNLFPRFVNKFRMINSVMSLGNKVKKGFIDIGMDKLKSKSNNVMDRFKEEECP